jgi:hypothetical protein
VLSEEKLDETGARLEHSPWKSFRYLALQPACSLNLNQYVFYSWGTINQKVYRSNIDTIEELKGNIQREVLCFP